MSVHIKRNVFPKIPEVFRKEWLNAKVCKWPVKVHRTLPRKHEAGLTVGSIFISPSPQLLSVSSRKSSLKASFFVANIEIMQTQFCPHRLSVKFQNYFIIWLLFVFFLSLLFKTSELVRLKSTRNKVFHIQIQLLSYIKTNCYLPKHVAAVNRTRQVTNKQ